MRLPQKIFLVLLLLIFQPAFAQVAPVKKDTAKTSMYKNIEKYSKKRKFTKFVHGLIFEPLSTKSKKERKKIPRKRFTVADQGKIIRKINIVTLDPFGYSELDTTVKPKNSLSRFGNRVHLKTKNLTIWNLLLIRRNKPLDTLLLKESERLIRTQRYIRRVAITPRNIATTSDSIDIDVRVQDSWSLIPDFSATSSRATYELTERNFLGFGHQIDNTYKKNLDNSDDAYSVRYTIPNIMNTYIRTTLNYQKGLDNDYSKSINIERPFFSPYARWAAGVYFDQVFKTDTLPDAANIYARQNFKLSTKDVWAGHSFPIFKGQTEDAKTTNLITTARFLKINYQESPEIAYDTINFYSNESSYLFGIGIASRQFVEDKYLFNYGIIEDVPVGKAIGITSGWQKKNNVNRMYGGARISAGSYYKWGYLSGNLEYGSYFNNGEWEQHALSFQTNYFTNLIEAGNWKFRQFIKTQLMIGNDRKPSLGDQLTLNESRGIRGFNTALYGTKRLLIGFQTQSYSPWNWWGFRVNPYLSYTMGMLGDGANGFKKSRAYSQFGIGIIISNDYLVFNNFQLSLSFYPVIPNDGENILKTNAFDTEDFGFQDFDIAKPRTVIYE